MSEKRTDLSRRGFIASGIGGMLTAGTLGIGNPAVLLQTGAAQDSTAVPGPILHRTLGNTGISIPVVNMGVMNATNPELVKRSFEIGVRHFDTAAYYQRGQNERMVGAAIRELGVRDQVIIGTKVFIPQQQRSMSSEDIKSFYLKTASESLERLQMSHVDILYAHNVQHVNYLNNPGVLGALQELKKRGITRFIGFTTHTNMAECIEHAAESGMYDVIATAFNYAMADDEILMAALHRAASKGIGLVAMKTQCIQYWYRQYVPTEGQKFYDGKIMHTAVLKWALNHPFITTAIPGYTTFDQMNQDFSVVRDLRFTPEERDFLEEREVKLSLDYCRQCRQCVASCTHGVDIPTLMRTHLYAYCYGNPCEARIALQGIPAGRSLEACAGCSRCSANCSHGIDIPGRIQELLMTYS